MEGTGLELGDTLFSQRFLEPLGMIFKWPYKIDISLDLRGISQKYA